MLAVPPLWIPTGESEGMALDLLPETAVLVPGCGGPTRGEKGV